MKKLAMVLVLLLLLALCLLTQACGQAMPPKVEGMEGASAPSAIPAVITPASSPTPAQTPKASPAPKALVLDDETIVNITVALNQVVRHTLDYWDPIREERYNPMYEEPKYMRDYAAQHVKARVFTEAGNRYQVFLKLGDDYTFSVSMEHSLLHGCTCRSIDWGGRSGVEIAHAEARVGTVLSIETGETCQDLGEFDYYFDPNCTYEPPAHYFNEIWVKNRETLVAATIEQLADYLDKGEYLLLFCEYSEEKARETGDARVMVVVSGVKPNGYIYENIGVLTIENFSKGFFHINGMASQIELDYYKALEFDREVFIIE